MPAAVPDARDQPVPGLMPEGSTLRVWHELLARLAAELHQMAAHPARSVVLLPYLQLLPLARRLWAEQFPNGFAPRFETTHSWAADLGTHSAGPSDLAFDHGRDLLTAGGLLAGAGLGGQAELLATPLVEQASELAQAAASLPPTMRPDWAELAAGVLPSVSQGPLQLEGALGRVAVAWAANSDYATDVLFQPHVIEALDALIIVPGLQPDPLVGTLAERHPEKAIVLEPRLEPPAGHVSEHVCSDSEDEAERAAACVLHHVKAGRMPVALVATDRALTRRIGALLATRGVRPGFELRDETGWRLSTTHAAACVMASLEAAAWQASTDAVLDWIKMAPALADFDQRGLEQRLREKGVRSWRQAAYLTRAEPLTTQVQALRQSLEGERSLADWVGAMRSLLEASGLWPRLTGDVAGCALIEALGLDDASLVGWRDWPTAQRRVSLAKFSHWVRQALEAASFRPPHPGQAQVVVLPLVQLLGRPFAALVLPGADEQRLPAAPEPSGPWSQQQRQELFLPGRQEFQRAQEAAWKLAIAVPHVDVLWRQADDSGEPLLPSPLLELLRLDSAPVSARTGADGRVLRRVEAAPTSRPQPSGDALPILPLSASGYEMLRACPYRFFALRQLGLQEEGELDADIDKRDWGLWLHAVLHAFHETLQANPRANRLDLMNAMAAQTTQALGLEEEPGEFMPFSAAWPPLRDAYLKWLEGHEDEGATFRRGEETLDIELGLLQLRGRVDRIDRDASGAPLLIDYKTESQDTTRKRIRAGHEETQLPFYALLSGSDTPRAAYLNLAERKPPTLYEVPELQHLAAELYEGMVSDVEDIQAGAPLPALGEGSICDWCDARGLCRKDFWS